MAVSLLPHLQGLVTFSSTNGASRTLGDPFGRHLGLCQTITKRMPEIVRLEVANARELCIPSDEVMDRSSGNWLFGTTSGSI